MVRDTCVPQSYDWSAEAQVEWFEDYADRAGERIKLQVFPIGSMASGAAFHWACLHAPQRHFWKRIKLAYERAEYTSTKALHTVLKEGG